MTAARKHVAFYRKRKRALPQQKPVELSCQFHTPRASVAIRSAGLQIPLIESSGRLHQCFRASHRWYLRCAALRDSRPGASATNWRCGKSGARHHGVDRLNHEVNYKQLPETFRLCGTPVALTDVKSLLYSSG